MVLAHMAKHTRRDNFSCGLCGKGSNWQSVIRVPARIFLPLTHRFFLSFLILFRSCDGSRGRAGGEIVGRHRKKSPSRRVPFLFFSMKDCPIIEQHHFVLI